MTINVFGFLSLNTPKIPGNAGLRDQVTLLRWVQRNARAFGGDPSDVTLAGQSAGASCAHLLSLVILMSGSAIPAFYTVSPIYAKQAATRFLTILGINSTDPDLIHDKLVTTPLEDILNANTVFQYESGLATFVPVREDQRFENERIVDDDPITLIEQGRGKEYPMIVGFSNNECEFFKRRLLYLDILGRIKANPLVILRLEIPFTTLPNVALALANKVIDWYFHGKLNIEDYLEVCRDTFFVYPAFKVSEWRAKMHEAAPVYLYQFAYEADFSAVKAGLNLEYNGTAHVEDLTNIFRENALLDDRQSFPPVNRDDSMKDWMTQFVTEFMNCDKPTCSESGWYPVQADHLNYQNIQEPTVYDNVVPTKCQGQIIKFFDMIEQIASFSSILCGNSQARPFHGQRTILINVVLVVATSALHLNEHGIHYDQISTSPSALNDTSDPVLAHTVAHSVNLAASDEIIEAVADNATYEKLFTYIDIQYGTFNSLFEAPVAPKRSDTVHEIKEHASQCPQLQEDKDVGDKDCLTLSIFKPTDVKNVSVLVHIHEGNFIGESADPAIYGPEYLVSKDVILVLPNYRLGPLGFLCTQDETAPGNAALKDLSLALSWVKTNIEKFGGNPENIAVSGSGTAGALAGYLALSPMSRENVHKVIIESGSVLSHWAIDRDPISTARLVASKIENFKSFEDVDLKKLLKAAKNISLRPCLEKTEEPFMTETPWTILEKKEIKVPFMMGTAKFAGVHEFISLTQNNVQEINDDVGLLLPDDLHFTSGDERTRIGHRVKTEYFGEDAISLSSVEPLTLYYTDAAYLAPTIRTARPLVASGATVYFYEFSFVGKLNIESQAIKSTVNGAVRGDIIGYIFTQDGVEPEESTDERAMVDRLVGLWTSFINTGTPTATGITWEKFDNEDPDEEPWLSIDTEVIQSKGMHVSRMTLWAEIYNEYFVEKSLAYGMSPSICTVLVLQALLSHLGVVLIVSTVTCVTMGRPTPVPRVHRDVVTLQGTVRGYLASNPPHFAYFGIPYAQSPTRSGRFKDPEPPPKWDGIFEALHKIKCPQLKADGEENCLVVNIFTPEEKAATLLPVIVFVHGGEFQNGWGAYRPPRQFLEEGNNVIVTFNYRLGSLGFLCLKTPDAPGNAGLKDQIAALYWVHRNVQQFGGSPQDVTLYAIEAGAVSVQLILLSGLAEGLLHKVILESGSVLSPAALQYDPLDAAYKGAASLGYKGSDDPNELYEFYLHASDKELVTIPESFLPCVDNTSDNVHNLIDLDPIQKLEEGMYTKVPMIITFTQKDTKSILGTDLQRFENPPDNFEYLLPNNLEFMKEEVKSEVAKIVKKHSMAHNYAYYIQDILVDYPTIKAAIMFAAKNTYPVYVMKFSLPKTSWDSILTQSLTTCIKKKKQSHFLVELVTMLIRNFKTLGDPTPLTTTLIPILWEPVSSDGDSISNMHVLHFGPSSRITMSSHNNPRLKFWDKIYTRFHSANDVTQDETEDLLNSKDIDDHDDNDLYRLAFVEEK
ncbi:hypothetical protein HW555_009067 [Spodoptera exigua]|uniref:Carboxylesterase type B domain-containing protein n=1 Tax=Spodoptera exigua TaxID=7107 RepID=A0A835GDS3_SPOEX|nr:hypothetical protein HW555_009067 [Spodoptera exigua]